MAFAYVLDPTNQFQNRAGVNNVHGYFKVYLANTDDLAVTYKDFNGTLNTENIDIDNNGRAVIIADSSRPYRVEMYEPNGELVFTQQPVWTMVSGGGMTMVDIESTDGSVAIDKTSAGGITTYDLSANPEDDPEFLDWIKCSWYDLVDGAYVPRYSSGTMSVGAKGVVLTENMHYHVTATVRAVKSGASPFYDNVGVHFSLFDGENTVSVQDFTRIVDHSLGLSQEFQVDADVHVGSIGSQLVVTIDGAMEGLSFNLVSLDAHRIYSGVPKVPDGIARQDWVEQNYAALADLAAVAFSGAYADLSGLPQISAVGLSGNYVDLNGRPDLSVYARVSELNAVAFSGAYADLSGTPDLSIYAKSADLAAVATSGSYNSLRDKPDLSIYAQTSSLATVSRTGSYNDLSNKPTIPAAQVNSDWNASSGVSAVLNKPANLVQDANYVHTDNNFTNQLKTKLDGIESGAQVNVNADWNSSSGDSRILNKPVLATVATTGDFHDLVNVPQIPDFTNEQMAAVNSGINSTKVSAYDNHVADSTIHVTSTDKSNWNAKEDASNKKQTLDPTSTTDFPSSAATANFVNSSVATNTATFRGNFTLTDLGLTYPATNTQIATALDSHQWPVGETPTNNDYVYVEVKNPQTTSIDDVVERFKYNGTNWGYEYTLNNSSFTAAEKASIDSGINSTKVSAYDAHVADSTIHVTAADKTAWSGKQDAISDLATIRSGASAGATAVQPSDLATVATTGDWSDILNKPSNIVTDANYVHTDENFTSALQTKLNGIESGAQVNVNADWNAAAGTAGAILNKPNIPADYVAGTGIAVTSNLDGTKTISLDISVADTESF